MSVNKIIKFFLIVFIIITVFGIGILYGKKQSFLTESPKIINIDDGKPQDIDFSLFWDTWRLLEEKYPNKPDKTKMLYGAISGMVNSLNDPYTTFMNPEETIKFSEELSGVFEGIGAEIGIKKEIITIIAPLANTPAEKAGLKPMDKILKINDTSTSDLSLYEAVNLIRGKKGTIVNLAILRGNESEVREFKIIRDTIEVKSVELEFKNSIIDSEKGDIAVIKISRFGDDTFQGIVLASDKILSKSANKIILDLRNNPGGFLDSAVDIAGIFLPAGKIVTIQKYNNSQKEYYTNGENKLGKFPLVILANEGSASAAEILAGALRDNRQVKIIGEKTYGKGSVQEMEKLKNNSSLKITIAEWLTPSGKNINKEGLKPDIAVKITPEDLEAGRDPQMEQALDILKEISKNSN